GHLAVVDRLVAARAAVEARDDRGVTPLNIAAEKGHWEVAQRLIEARADLEAKDDAGSSEVGADSLLVEHRKLLLDRSFKELSKKCLLICWNLKCKERKKFEGVSDNARIPCRIRVFENDRDITEISDERIRIPEDIFSPDQFGQPNTPWKQRTPRQLFAYNQQVIQKKLEIDVLRIRCICIACCRVVRECDALDTKEKLHLDIWECIANDLSVPLLYTPHGPNLDLPDDARTVCALAHGPGMNHFASEVLPRCIETIRDSLQFGALQQLLEEGEAAGRLFNGKFRTNIRIGLGLKELGHLTAVLQLWPQGYRSPKLHYGGCAGSVRVLFGEIHCHFYKTLLDESPMEFQDGDCGLQLPPGRHQQLVFPAGETTWLNRQNWWVRETWCGSGDFALVLHLYKSCTDEFAFVKPGEDGRAVLEKGGPKNDFFWNLDLPDTDERLREIGEIVGPKDFAEIVLKPQVYVYVGLLSGQSVACVWERGRTIKDLQKEAEQRLDAKIQKLITRSGETLPETSTLLEAGVGHQHFLTAIASSLGARWHVVLIANNSTALKQAVQDAELVGRALLRCGFCKREQDLLKVFNKTGDEIKETLEQLICHLPQDAQLFVWFSGKSGGMLQESFQETLLVPESQIDWKNNTAIETIRGLWLEDTLFGMIARKEGLKLWCVVAACRLLVEDLRAHLRGRDPRCTLRLEEMPHAHNIRLLKKQQYQFLYACDLGKDMYDSCIFAKSFCYQMECQPGYLADFNSNLAMDLEVMSFGDLREPRSVGNLRNPLEDNRLTLQAGRNILCDRKWLDTMRQEKLLAYHLCSLADYETFEDTPSEEEYAKDLESLRDSYDQYESVRETAMNIIQGFYQCARHFDDFRHQIWLLSCESLHEVKEVLAKHQAAFAVGRGCPRPPTDWNPGDPSDAELLINDHHGMLNLPETVIRVIGMGVRRLKNEDKREAFPAESVLTMLQELGFYFTATMYEHKLSACKEDKVRKRLYDLQMNYLVGEGMLGVTSPKVAERVLMDRCEKLCLSKDEMEVIQQEMRFRETGGGQHNEPGEFAVLMDQN
ncbi:A disintegrin and metalloproteinase with thrombospondin motifs 9, partial [Durusdinium trenchii]